MGKDRKKNWNSAARKQVAIETEKETKTYSKSCLITETVSTVKIERQVRLTKVLLVAEDSYKAAEGISNSVVLDFASDSNPGGGWRGGQTGTQEESLCRRSTLGIALEKHSSSGGYPINNNNVIYVPKVMVFRGTEEEDYNSRPPFETSVIAAALRNSDNTKQLMNSTDSVVVTAVNKKHSSVVLGAWGCGAFGNSPSSVAAAFASSLKKVDSGSDPFTVIFAIPNSNNDSFYEFTDVLSKAFPDIIEIMK